MATDANETSTDEQDQKTHGAADEKSQEEMKAEFEQEREEQYAESRRKVGTVALLATVVLGVIGLSCLYVGTLTTGNHPLVQNGLYAVGVLNLLMAFVIQIRKNWTRASTLVLMPITMVIIVLTFVNTTPAALGIVVLCILEIYILFRQPVLDQYDAPKE